VKYFSISKFKVLLNNWILDITIPSGKVRSRAGYFNIDISKTEFKPIIESWGVLQKHPISESYPILPW